MNPLKLLVCSALVISTITYQLKRNVCVKWLENRLATPVCNFFIYRHLKRFTTADANITVTSTSCAVCQVAKFYLPNEIGFRDYHFVPFWIIYFGNMQTKSVSQFSCFFKQHIFKMCLISVFSAVSNWFPFHRFNLFLTSIAYK